MLNHTGRQLEHLLKSRSEPRNRHNTRRSSNSLIMHHYIGAFRTAYSKRRNTFVFIPSIEFVPTLGALIDIYAFMPTIVDFHILDTSQ